MKLQLAIKRVICLIRVLSSLIPSITFDKVIFLPTWWPLQRLWERSIIKVSKISNVLLWIGHHFWICSLINRLLGLLIYLTRKLKQRRCIYFLSVICMKMFVSISISAHNYDKSQQMKHQLFVVNDQVVLSDEWVEVCVGTLGGRGVFTNVNAFMPHKRGDDNLRNRCQRSAPRSAKVITVRRPHLHVNKTWAILVRLETAVSSTL